MAEVRKVSEGLIPRLKNSEAGRASPRSVLFKRRKTGFFERRAVFAIFLSRKSGYFVASRVRRIRSAEAMASEI